MNTFDFSLPVWLLFFSAFFSLGLAIYIVTRRRAPGSMALSALAILIAEWAFTYGLEINAPSLEEKIFWARFEYIGIAFIPFFWLLFALTYTSQGKSAQRLLYLSFLALFPLVTVALALSNDLHGLIWQETFLLPAGSITVLGVEYGLWFWIHFTVSYVLLLTGTIVVLSRLRRIQGLYRSQILALFFAVILPWLGNVVYFTTPIAIDPTPFAFNLTIALLVWAIFGFRLVDVAPIARELILDGLREGVIVLDLQGRIVDINAQAAHFIGLKPAQMLGQPVDEILKPWQSLLERFRGVLEANETVKIGSGEAARELAVRIGPLYDERKNLVGRLISFAEVGSNELARPAFQFEEPLRESVPGLPQTPVVLPEDTPHSFWQVIRAFFFPAVIEVDTNQVDNPIWAQTIERGITVSARFVMIFGSIVAWSTLSSLNLQTDIGYALVILLFLASVYFLALARSAPFSVRVRIFVVLIYAMALAEMLKYGFSADVFVYFVALVLLSHLLLNVQGGFAMLFLAIATMIVFSWAVLSGTFVPLETTHIGGIILPTNLSSATTNIIGYLFSSLTMMTVVNMFIVNLNQAWKKEVQALNLVQQERTLLEQRVRQRTADLAEARDLAVQRSKELRKYFQAIEQSGNSIMITDKTGNIEYVNPYFEQNTGYARAEALGKKSNLLKSGNQSAEFYKEMWQTINAGQVWRGELHNKRKDGSLFWEAAAIAPVQGPDGEITNYVAIKEDITAQKELREQIDRQNEYLVALQSITLELLNRRNLDDLLTAVVERACALMDVSSGLIALRNEDGEFIFRATTQPQARMLGQRVIMEKMKYTARAIATGEPVIVNNYFEIEPPYKVGDSGYLQCTADFPIVINGEVIGVLALGRLRENYPFTPAQVETAPLFAQMVSLVLDNASLYDSAMKEIEQRKLAEEQNLRFLEDMKSMQEVYLALSQVEGLSELYVQMIDMAQRRLGLDRVGLFVVDEDGNEMAGTFGVDPSGMVRDERYYRESITKDHWTLEIVNAPNHAKLWLDAPLFDDGKQVGLGWKAATALWNGYQPIGYLVCDAFLTRRLPRPYETELVSLLGNTYGHLIERKRAEQQLAAARDQALEASRFKSQLLAKVSHELRTPLGAIIGYAELLQYNVMGEITTEQRDAVEKIAQSGSYLSEVVNELLDQSQIESKKVQLKIEPFSPVNLVEQIHLTMSVLAKNKGLAFDLLVGPEVPESVLGDVKRIQQILINLTGNAIKFTMSGSVRIEVLRADESHWAARVIDTGAGIPAEAQSYIFEPFRQVDNAITYQNRGTGLGLSIARQLVELMRGKIELQSEVGKGSIFTVTLPIFMEWE